MSELDANILYNDSDSQTYSRLILCIEEHDNKKNDTSIDTRLFIGWVEELNEYFVRGRRQDINGSNYVPYGFHCKHTDELYEFIEFVVGSKGKKSMSLYNFNNISHFVDDELNYEFFESCMDREYEISGYDNVKLSSIKTKKILRMLKSVVNIKH